MVIEQKKFFFEYWAKLIKPILFTKHKIFKILFPISFFIYNYILLCNWNPKKKKICGKTTTLCRLTFILNLHYSAAPSSEEPASRTKIDTGVILKKQAILCSRPRGSQATHINSFEPSFPLKHQTTRLLTETKHTSGLRIFFF